VPGNAISIEDPLGVLVVKFDKPRIDHGVRAAQVKPRRQLTADVELEAFDP
jgi:hypothetical protein